MREAVASSRGGVMVLYTDRLALYNPALKKWFLVRTAWECGLGLFSRIVAGFNGEFWITAAHGMAKLESDLHGWTQIDTRRIGVEDVDHPNPSAGGGEVCGTRRPYTTRLEGSRGVVPVSRAELGHLGDW